VSLSAFPGSRGLKSWRRYATDDPDLIPVPRFGGFRYIEGMTAFEQKRRWFHLSPGHLLFVLLAVEGNLILFNAIHWIPKGWAVLCALAAVVLYLLVMPIGFVLSLIFRWHFQFSIRLLLVLMLAVAVPSSWFAVEMKAAREQQILREKIKSLEPGVSYCTLLSASNTPRENLLGLDDLLGEPFFENILQVSSKGQNADSLLALLVDVPTLIYLNINNSDATDAGLKHINELTNLEELRLSNTQITDSGLEHIQELIKLQELWLSHARLTDAGLVHIKGLFKLRCLYLNSNPITDAGLKQIAELTQLECLNLDSTRITDAGLEHLRALIKLERLTLNNTPITDAGLMQIKGLTKLHILGLNQTPITDVGLEQLVGLTNLEQLYLEGTQVTDEGVKKLQQALPHCSIEH
jgi:hypothetical protein